MSWPLVCWDVWSLTYVDKSLGLRTCLSCPEVAFGTSEWGQGGRVGTACAPGAPRVPIPTGVAEDVGVPGPPPVMQAWARPSLGDRAPRRQAGPGVASAGSSFSFRAGQAAARPPSASLWGEAAPPAPSPSSASPARRDLGAGLRAEPLTRAPSS